MSEDLLPSLEEMQQLLSKRAPLCFTRKHGEHVLYFFGGNHSHDPLHPQYDVLLTFWNDFLSYTSLKVEKDINESAAVSPARGHCRKEALVFIEGGLRPLSSSKEEAIKSWSEAGLLTYLASEADVALLSPEPSAQAEREYILRYCAEEEMMLYHVSCIAHQWAHMPSEETFEAYVARFLEKEYPHLSFDEYCQAYQRITGEGIAEGNLAISKHLHPWVHVSALNKAAYFSTRYRDLCLLEYIQQHLQQFDIFVAYGIGHGVVVEYALTQV